MRFPNLLLTFSSLLVLASGGCDLGADHCIGNCALLTDGGTAGPEGTLGDSSDGMSSPHPTDPTTDSEPATSEGDTATTEPEPDVMLGTCDFVDQPPHAKCGDQLLEPGDLCYGQSFTSPVPAGVNSSLALPLDGDAAVDLLLAYDDRTLTAVLNAPGPFAPALVPLTPEFAEPGVLSLIAGGDLDEDGIVDVVARIQEGFENSTVYALFLDGQGGIASTAVIATPDQQLTTLDLVDWDADGHLDIVSVDNSVDVIVLRGDGSGEFVSTPGPDMPGVNGWHALDALDADAAADDFVFALGTGGIDITRNIGGTLHLSHLDVPGRTVLSVAIADLDQDGLGDIIGYGLNIDAGHGTPEIVVALQADGFALTYYPVHCGSSSPVFANGDLDGDGRLDIVAASHEVTARRNNGAGGFARAVGGHLVIPPERLHIADVNGDGGPDLVGVLDDQLSIMLSTL